jgi:hypothetical protein
MKITIQKLESLLANECDRIDDLRIFGSVSPEVYAMLYVAAREGSIDVADALFSARRCGRLTAFLIDQVITADDIDSVRQVADHIFLQHKKISAEHESTLILRAWLGRQSIRPRS